MMPRPRAEELRNLARTVSLIDANQEDRPGCNADIADAIVRHELNMLEDETRAADQAQMERHIDKLERWVKGLEADE